MEYGARLTVGGLGEAVGMPDAVRHATVIVVGSAIAFQCLNISLNYGPVPPKYDNESRFRWRNITTSFIHSLISGFSSCYCLYIAPEILADVIHHYSPMTEVLVSLSVGYFMYDLVDMLINRPIRSTWPLLIHHVVIFICFGISLYLRTYIGYALVALVAEINSVFLHLRQIFLMMGISKTAPVYQLNGMINISTYVIFRFGVLLWMFQWILSHRLEIPTILFALGTSGLVVMSTINLVLFKRLLVSDFLSPGDKLKRDKNVLEK